MGRNLFSLPVQIVLAIAVSVVLVASPLYPILSPSYPGRLYELEGFPPSDRFSTPERTRLASTIWRFCRGAIPYADLTAMATDSGETALLPSEAQHLEDVRLVVRAFTRAHVAGLILAVLGAVLLWRRQRRQLVWALRAGVLLAVGILALIAISALVDFDTFFTAFHGLFFVEGTWTFRYTDTLIQLYPLPFWTTAVLHYALLIGALSAATLGLAGGLQRVDAQEHR
ncbi:MAG: TIGR01906 family membrane protein [Anaerolineae bacterium]|jgi:integral membrane protein (TIGR01906 family)|nr:TIGR01906 family membrane protein [Chloroflexota bacterium]